MALVITIIVLLILAGITIGMLTGDNGIINNAENAKEQTEIANEKEIIDQATIEAMGRNKRGNLVEEEFQEAMDRNTKEGETEVTDIGSEFEVYFKDSNRYYMVDKNGSILDYEIAVTDPYPGNITKDENGNDLQGTEEEPYQINCIEDLVALSNIANRTGKVYENGKLIEAKDAKELRDGANIILTRDLDFKSRASYVDSQRTDFGDINGDNNDGNSLITEMTNENGTGFPPINLNNDKFVFDGKSHSISNLYEKNRVEEKNLGLFGETKHLSTEIVISNLEVNGKIDNKLENTSGGSSTGGILGNSRGKTKIYNCKTNVEIFANGYGAGGIVGRVLDESVEIINCANLGKINNLSESTGGIIGRIETKTAKILNSYNIGEIASKGSIAGGVIGQVYNSNSYIKVENVYNLGEISKNGTYGRGGIIGRTQSNQNDIINAYNLEDVIDESINWMYSAGAIVGRVENGAKLNIKNSYYLSRNCSKPVGNTEETFSGITAQDKIEGKQIMEQFNTYIEDNSLRDEGWKNWKIAENEYPIFE